MAVIGLDCRFPGAANPREFWRNLSAGKESVTFFSAAQLAAAGVPAQVLRDPSYVPAAGVLAGADEFDAEFFRINPNEAGLMDPQHRLVLECAWSALEDAGYVPDGLPGRTGVFVGGFHNDHAALADVGDDHAALFLRNVANEPDFLATRVSFKLDLTGPSLTVQTACSTSLVAVHLAVESLLAGSSDLALAGGVTVRAGQHPGYFHQEGGIFSADGHCRAFDAAAAGTVIGEGLGLVVLKRLADAVADGDPIRAVILGSASGNDGAARVGFSAPGVAGQARIVRAALERAGVDVGTIGYVETHGSGTPMGDRIEVDALTRAFRELGWRAGSRPIGSVKTNIGHTHAAAGIAGLIKTVLALEHGQLPPSLHFAEPNPRIDFSGSPFHVNAELTAWPDTGGRRRAAVSSFGLGGTGAHVVLEEAPPVPVRPAGPGDWQVLTISARTASALEAATDALADHLDEHPDADLGDVGHTLQVGRRAFRHRRTVLARTGSEAAAALRARTPRWVASGVVDPRAAGSVAFMFPGLGDQYPGMGRELYRTQAVFRQAIDECCALLAERCGIDLLPVLYPAGAGERAAGAPGDLDLRAMLRGPTGSAFDATRYAHPALFAVEYALARQWQAWGIEPDAMIGYSLGEYVAAHLAGVLSLGDAIYLVAERARLIEELPAGAMLAVALPPAEIGELLGGELAVAAVNGPDLCVVAGPEEAVAALAKRLPPGVAHRRLRTGHAFHSAMMRPVTAALTRLASGLDRHPPAVPYLSNVTGDWITADEATDPAYWARHLCQEVRFAAGAAKLCERPGRILLEVGPGQSLCGFALRAVPEDARPLAVTSLPPSYDPQPDPAVMLASLGKLWLSGVPVNWPGGHARPRRVHLPTYPFERRPYRPGGTPRASLVKRPDPADWCYVPGWEQLPPALAGGAAEPATWLLFADDDGIAERLARLLRERGHRVTTAEVGAELHCLGEDRYELPCDSAEAYAALLAQLREQDRFPNRVAHLWSAGAQARGPAEDLRRGFTSLLLLAQALGADAGVDVSVITSGVYPVGAAGEGGWHPGRAAVLGPCRVWPQESPNVSCRMIDIAVPAWSPDALLAELLGPPAATVVALRGRRRWAQRFQPVRAEDIPGAPRAGGTYLITGGLGGIGHALAGHLAAAGANLVLTSRHGLPPRAEWDALAASRDPDDETASRVRQVLELERAGARVLVAAADVTDTGAMRAVVRAAKEQFGPITGVVHAAGVAGGGLIGLKDPGLAAQVLAPKVTGALVLREVIDPAGLDFVVYCSSGLAVLGGVGQVDYCAANSVLDVLAHQAEAAGGPLTVSVNWDAWQEVGMAVRNAGSGAGFVHEQLEQGLLPAEGVEIFRRVLAHRMGPQVLVVTKDLDAAAASVAADAARPAAGVGPAKDGEARRDVLTPYVEPADDVQRELARIWQDLLGVRRVGINDNFFELGGHSLLGIQLSSRLGTSFGCAVPLRALFDAPTVAEMAAVVKQAQQP